MIDAQEMLLRQKEGQELIHSLQEDEAEILRHYSSLVSELVMKQGFQIKAPFDQVTINAVKAGIAIGLRLDIKDGEVLGRE